MPVGHHNTTTPQPQISVLADSSYNMWKNSQHQSIHMRSNDPSRLSVPCVLVSALGQRDGDGGALPGLGVCRGLMEELRLFRTALGAAELARVWAAVAPRKPERKA